VVDAMSDKIFSDELTREIVSLVKAGGVLAAVVACVHIVFGSGLLRTLVFGFVVIQGLQIIMPALVAIAEVQ
jgi:hypothetical protein